MTAERICIITETFAPEVNGVANTLSHLVKGMLSQGIQVLVIRPRQHKNDSGNTSDAFQTVTLPGLPIPGYDQLKFGLPNKNKLKSALQDFAPDAIYIATEGPMGYTANRVAKQLNIPVLSGFHTNFHQYIEHYHLGAFENLAYRYLRHFHNQTAGTLVPTNNQKSALEQYGFDNVSVLSRGVDSQLFSPSKRCEQLRAEWGLKEDDIALIYVGRIANEKNIQLALSAYQELKEDDPKLKFVLVGDGPLLNSIRQQHKDVIICGMQTGEALAKHYASGDIFLFPSKTDTFGNVVTEAMASGLAVVSFNYAAASEHIKHGINGMVCDLNNDQQFADQVATLLDRPHLLKDIKHNAFSHSLTISWHAIVENFTGLLSSLKKSSAEPKSLANTPFNQEGRNGKSQLSV